jgi:hypothetical protein
MLQPKYSMHGFNWFDRRGTEGVGFIKALRTLLTNHLPVILPDLRIAISDRMSTEVKKLQGADGKADDPKNAYPCAYTCRRKKSDADLPHGRHAGRFGKLLILLRRRAW